MSIGCKSCYDYYDYQNRIFAQFSKLDDIYEGTFLQSLEFYYSEGIFWLKVLLWYLFEIKFRKMCFGLDDSFVWTYFGGYLREFVLCFSRFLKFFPTAHHS